MKTDLVKIVIILQP